MSRCIDPLTLTWPADCTDLDGTVASDLETYARAKILLEAARQIAATSKCAASHRCREGDWLVAQNTTGVTLGAPVIGDCCCGAITVGIHYAPADSRCVSGRRVEYQLVVSWPCGTPIWHQSAEVERLIRLIPDAVCCLTRAVPDLAVSGVELVDIDTVIDDCLQMSFTYRFK